MQNCLHFFSLLGGLKWALFVCSKWHLFPHLLGDFCLVIYQQRPSSFCQPEPRHDAAIATRYGILSSTIRFTGNRNWVISALSLLFPPLGKLQKNNKKARDGRNNATFFARASAKICSCLLFVFLYYCVTFSARSPKCSILWAHMDFPNCRHLSRRIGASCLISSFSMSTVLLMAK